MPHIRDLFNNIALHLSNEKSSDRSFDLRNATKTSEFYRLTVYFQNNGRQNDRYIVSVSSYLREMANEFQQVMEVFQNLFSLPIVI